jgi:signal transduction histidine kinase
MADRAETAVLTAFALETQRVIARRAPLGLGFALGVAAVAGLLELAYYPTRLPMLLTTFGAEVVLVVLGILGTRREELRRHAIPITVAATLGIVLCITVYVVGVGASGDALVFALIISLTGVALLCPWGARGQVPLAVGTAGSYLVAIAAGVRSDLPLPYGILAVAGGGVTSVLGAVFLELHRRAIFQQRVLLERNRDQQMATLYEVSRTVTSTLELQQVLRLVCQTVLGALDFERLWLFWREAPNGDLRGLLAGRTGDQVTLTEVAGDPAGWEPFLRLGSDDAPSLVEPSVEERAALSGASALPSLVLRLSLRFQSELVGIILADVGSERRALTTHFLELAATLGNSAAMAIATARLYAVVLQQQGELQRVSNRRLDMVEEGMRRMSRELHDGTCQALMAIKLELALLERRLGSETGTLRASVRDIGAQVLDVMHGVRQMSHLLHPPVLDDFGALAAMESTAAKYREASGLEVRVECADAGMRFVPAVELLLFRVFQEALTNVVKHAGAHRVTVRFAREESGVVLEIEDDGGGFDAQTYFRTPPPSAGLGLLSIRERVAHFGGRLAILSRPGSGTRVVVRVPAEPLPTTRVAAAS